MQRFFYASISLFQTFRNESPDLRATRYLPFITRPSLPMRKIFLVVSFYPFHRRVKITESQPGEFFFQ